MSEKPWRDESLLREMYHEDDMSQYEIADELGCTQVTVSNSMDDFSISIDREEYSKLYDSEWLDEKYWGEMMSQREIAKELGCAYSTVARWLKNHNIERRKTCKERPPYFQTNTQGYETIASRCDGKLEVVAVHQLLALAEGVDPWKVFSNGEYHVHHENELRWDNRRGNIEMKNRKEHGKHHHG